MPKIVRSRQIPFAALLLVAAGCAPSQPAAIVGWYTTTEPLPSYQGVLQLEQDAKSPRVYVVVKTQFPAKQFWVPTDGKGMKYRWSPDDFRLLTADGQEIAPKYGLVRGKFGTGDGFTDEPTDAISRIGVAFVVEESAVKAGGMKLRYRDLPVLELSADKKSEGSAP